VAVEDLAALAQRWRRAGGSMARVRVVADGARALAGLSLEERRLLARGLAERGAPELAERVAGRTPLSGGELTDAVRQLLSVDTDRLTAVAGDLRDPERRRELSERARQEVDALAAPPVAVPAGPTERTSPPPPAPVVATPTSTVVPEEAPEAAPDTAPDADAVAAAAVADEPPDDRLPTAVGPAVTAPAATPPDEVVPAGVDPATVDPADVAATLTALAAAGSAHERFVALRATVGRGVDGAGLVRILEAVPDGWQRRRIAVRLLTAGEVTDLDPAVVLARFARASDRVAVAATIVDHHLAPVDAATASLPDRAAARLRRRVGA
jgi:uncharacterized membrane protein